MVKRSIVGLLTRLSPVALAAIVLGVGVQPALADTKVSHTGTTGKHSLTDTLSSPGATCRYQHKAPGNYGKLVKIVVQPPNVRAVTGQSNESVGWKFEVQRRLAAGSEGPPGPWKHRYTSNEMKAVTDDSHDAAFTSASVPVIAGPPQTGGGFEYRVLVTMIWHRPDGSVQGNAVDRVDFYKEIQNTGGSTEENHDCDAWVFFA